MPTAPCFHRPSRRDSRQIIAASSLNKAESSPLNPQYVAVSGWNRSNDAEIDPVAPNSVATVRLTLRHTHAIPSNRKVVASQKR